MVQRLKQVLDSFLTDENEHHFVLAVSGGIDSMVLLACFHQLNLKLTIAHYNYGFRENSILEAEMIRTWCLRNNYPFYMKIHGLSSDRKWDQSLQSDARKMRYKFLQEVLEMVEGDFIVTAHHLNDNIETFLINALRGSGTKGLKGIPGQNGNIIRPLLDFRREEIDKYAQENNVSFIEDPSNASSDYLRNTIRNEVLPTYVNAEKSRNGMKGLARSLSLLQETDAFLEECLTSLEAHNLSRHTSHISLEDIDQVHPFLLKRYLRYRGFWDWQIRLVLEDQLMAEKILIGKNEILQRRDNRLIFVPIDKDQTNVTFQRFEDLSSDFNVDLIDKVEGFEIPPSNTFGLFCLDKLIFPLHLRNWLPGDRIKPLGMHGKHRKVQDVLTDQKIPTNIKSNVTVLEDARGRIIWIPDYARSVHALIDEGSRSIVCLSSKSIE